VKTVERDVHAVEIEQRGSGTGIPDVHPFTPPYLVR
jgi:hypothetical protein